MTLDVPAALAATGLAALFALPVVLALLRLPARAAGLLAAVLVAVAVVPLPAAGLPLRAALLLPWAALPAAWGLRRISARALRIAATRMAPAAVFARVWLPAALPWIGAGLALAFARALAG